MKSDALRLRCIKNCDYYIFNNNDNKSFFISPGAITMDLIVCHSFFNLSVNLKYTYKDSKVQSYRTNMHGISCARRNFATGKFWNQSSKF